MRPRGLLIGAGFVALPVVLFGLIQLVPAGVSYTNPPVVSEPAWDSPRTRALAQRACFDCHSNETIWPWYSRVAPISWLLARDVNEGRARLNFSTWGQPQQGGEGGRGERPGASQLVRAMQNGSMPPSIYLLPRPSARLTADEQQQLVQGFLATFK
jgi:Haem-binding domain